MFVSNSTDKSIKYVPVDENEIVILYVFLWGPIDSDLVVEVKTGGSGFATGKKQETQQ